MADKQTMILSGVAQNVYSSYADAKADASKGKLLFARVSGLTSGYDTNGNLVVGGTNLSKTYVFMGKKCYGSFPQLPVEMIKSLGITMTEASSEEGIKASFADSPILSAKTNIVEALKTLAENSGLQSSGKTIVVTNADGVNNVEVNYDGSTLSATTDGKIFTTLKVTKESQEVGSGVITTYKLVDAKGVQYGEDIKTTNDVFLKSAEVKEVGGVKGLLFTWYVRNEDGEVELTHTFIPLTDLDSYQGGSGITIDQQTNLVSVDLTKDENNILKLIGEGSASTLYASAVTAVTINGEKQNVEDVKFDHIVSGISGTIGGTEYVGEISEDGYATVNVAISASGVTFDSTNTKKLVPSISGDNVQDVIEEVVAQISAITDNTISGLSAISATTDASGNTEIQLNLNKTNTTSQGDGIIGSDEIGVDGKNAVKMSQSKDNGLFAYIEIVGDDVDDDDTPTPAQVEMYYTSTETTDESNALGITATKVND